jgi:hypothetical protein
VSVTVTVVSVTMVEEVYVVVVIVSDMVVVVGAPHALQVAEQLPFTSAFVLQSCTRLMQSFGSTE